MKAVLAQRRSVKGISYGPGEVDVSSEVYSLLEQRGALNDPLTQFPPLIAAGYTSLEEAQAQTDDKLLAVAGVGPAMLKKIRGE